MRRVANAFERLLNKLSTVVGVRFEHVTGLVVHRLWWVDVLAWPVGQFSNLLNESGIEEGRIGDNLVSVSTNPQHRWLRVDISQRRCVKILLRNRVENALVTGRDPWPVFGKPGIAGIVRLANDGRTHRLDIGIGGIGIEFVVRADVEGMHHRPR